MKLLTIAVLAMLLAGCDCGPTRKEVSQIKNPQWREIWQQHYSNLDMMDSIISNMQASNRILHEQNEEMRKFNEQFANRWGTNK